MRLVSLGILALVPPSFASDGPTDFGGQSGAPPRGAPSRGSPAPRVELPFAFLELPGTGSQSVRFVGSDGRTQVEVEAAAVTVTSAGDAGPTTTRFVFEGANTTSGPRGNRPEPGRFNLYRQVDGELRGLTGMTRFPELEWSDLYAGVGARLRNASGKLEYDLLLAPGAALDAVVVRCDGVESLEVASDGRLLLHTAGGAVLTQSTPKTWAIRPDGETLPVVCRYEILDKQRYGFATEATAEAVVGLPIVIDPVFEWSTLAGGSGEEDFFGVAATGQGRYAVGGSTRSAGWTLPGMGAPFGATSGGYDALIALLDPSATGAAQVVWWTVLGGPADDWIWDVALDSAGRIYAAGDTQSPSFPITPTAFDTTHNGSWDAFVAALDPATGTLVHSTFFGGALHDVGQEILVEDPMRVTLAGVTESGTLPTTASAFDTTFNGVSDAYIAILDLTQPGAASLLYSTYIGGNAKDGWVTEQQLDLERDSAGRLSLCTSTWSTNFPKTANAHQGTLAGSQDAAMVQLDPALPGASGLVYGTYLGTTGDEGGTQVEHLTGGRFLLGGFTYSAAFPTTAGAPFATFGGMNDAWVVVLDPSQPNQLQYSTHFGGDQFDGFYNLEVDPSTGVAFGSGFTGSVPSTSNTFPLTCGAPDQVFGPNIEGFLVALDPRGRGLDDVLFSSYFGGSLGDFPLDFAALPTSGLPRLIVVGTTNSPDFATTPGALQTTLGGTTDAFATILELNPFPFCEGNPNSGNPIGARVCATGSTNLATNALDLRVSGLPANSLGYFLYSTTKVAPNALPAPSQGALCLGGTIVRFRAFVQSSGATGMVLFRPDLANIPPPGTPLTPGTTGYFQYWYRDIGGTSNTSNGVGVTFD